MGNIIRMAGVIKESIVDGPGMRFVLFCQGCPRNCKGCHNPSTHDFNGGYPYEESRILDAIQENKLITGVTFSGGEPFYQAKALNSLADKIIEMGKDIVVYSGYTYEELLEMGKEDSSVKELLEKCRYLIDGPFVVEKKSLVLPFRGSTNQRIIDLNESFKIGRVVETEL